MAETPDFKGTPSPLDRAIPAIGARRLPPWLLQLLVCPVDRAVLRDESDALVCERCERHYPVRDGIPIMIPGAYEIEHKF